MKNRSDVRMPLAANFSSGPAGCPTRRDFMAQMAAAGAALVSSEWLAAQSSPGPRRIDVHHHYKPKAFIDFLKKYNQVSAGDWTVEADLEDMDKSGVATSILSITTPMFGFAPIEETRKACRDCNDAGAQLVRDHPGRFGLFVITPLDDTEGALREIEYGLDTLKADGICVFSSHGDKWLGHPSFAPVYEELNRRKTVVYVHPTLPHCCQNVPTLMSNVPNEQAMIEFATDSTRGIADLIFSGTSTRFPDMVWIFSHGGGNVPFAIERFLAGTSAEIVPGIVTKGVDRPHPPEQPAKGVMYELRKLYYDTAQVANPIALDALRKVIPVSQIVFGTDYWYRTAAETAKGLTTSKVFNAAELHAIDRGNAERILPRYRG